MFTLRSYEPNIHLFCFVCIQGQVTGSSVILYVLHFLSVLSWASSIILFKVCIPAQSWVSGVNSSGLSTWPRGAQFSVWSACSLLHVLWEELQGTYCRIRYTQPAHSQAYFSLYITPFLHIIVLCLFPTQCIKTVNKVNFFKLLNSHFSSALLISHCWFPLKI